MNKPKSSGPSIDEGQAAVPEDAPPEPRSFWERLEQISAGEDAKAEDGSSFWATLDNPKPTGSATAKEPTPASGAAPGTEAPAGGAAPEKGTPTSGAASTSGEASANAEAPEGETTPQPDDGTAGETATTPEEAPAERQVAAVGEAPWWSPLQGIGRARGAQLEEQGVRSVADFMARSAGEEAASLAAATKIPEAMILKVRAACESDGAG